MRAYWIKHDGKNATLEMREVPLPEPNPGEIVLRVRAASLNRGDLLGAIAFHRAAEGRPAGVDAAGEVHSVGEGFANFSAAIPSWCAPVAASPNTCESIPRSQPAFRMV